jgi:hypothetical protein
MAIDQSTDSDLRNGKIHDAREGVKWTAGCNPLRSAACTHNSTQVVPYGGEEETADASSSLSATKDGATLSANVSSTQLEELVMKEGSDPNAPLVILFGWAGCRDRYLQKYASYYQNEG